jgi:hypothetical protein
MSRLTTDLRAAFLDRMARAGMPLERVRGVKSGRGKGVFSELYRMPDARMVRLRTCRTRRLLSNGTGENATNASAPIILEGPQDFIGIAIAGRRGAVDCYLAPSQRVIDDQRAAHRAWQETQPEGGKSEVRCLHFDDDDQTPERPWFGFARKYAEFKLPDSSESRETAARDDQTTTEAVLDAAIAEAKRIVAAAVRKPESAVRIIVEW